MPSPTLLIPIVGEKILIKIGDGATPEVFAHPCLINAERAVSFTSETGESIVPDCANLSLPGFKQVFKDGLQVQVTGGGLVHTPSIEAYVAWQRSDDAKNVRIVFDAGAVNGGGYVTVPMKLTTFNITGPRKNNSAVEITLMSHGEYEWLDQPEV